MITKQQAWIAVGVGAAVLGFGYLATRREVNATVTAGEATISYLSIGDTGAGQALTPQENSHERMLQLIDISSERIRAHDAAAATDEPVPVL